ncbi:MAG: hypothetical protein K0S38_943 [Candidatus Paceibacter sp.]|nr:hypothetical protein [Candidatus Paceibacter sp.]
MEKSLDLVRKSFILYRSKFLVFLTLGTISFVIGLVQLLAIRIHSMSLFILSLLFTIVVSYIVYIAMIRAATEPARMSAGEVLARVEHFILPSVWVSLAMLLISLGGIFMLVIPGLIAAFLIMFAVFALIVDHYQQIDAIVYSWHLVKKQWLALFIRMFVANLIFGLIALGIFVIFWALGIGESPIQTVSRVRQGSLGISISQSILEQAVTNFFSVPVTISFMSILYSSAKRRVPDGPNEKEVESIKKIIKVLAVVGIIFLLLGFFASSLRLAQIIPELIRITHLPAAVFTAF